MVTLRLLPVAIFLLLLTPSAKAASPASSRVRTTAIVRVKEGQVELRCSHGAIRSWRGIGLHPGDTLRVGPLGWASVSVEATGARFLLVAGSKVRIENSQLYRLSGPMPQRSYDTPRRGSTTQSGREAEDRDEAGPADR